jgi:hypothetical protein
VCSRKFASAILDSPSHTFGELERATAKSVADSNPTLILDDPAIHGDQAIACRCDHDTVGEHNYAVTQRVQRSSARAGRV